MANRRSIADVLGGLLQEHGPELFDEIASHQPTADAKAKLRWQLPLIAEALVGSMRGMDEQNAARERSCKAALLSDLAVKLFASAAVPGASFSPERGAKESVRIAKIILDEAELLVLAEEDAGDVLERGNGAAPS